MNRFISLIKTDLNNTFGFSYLIYNFKKKKYIWQPIVAFLAILSFIPTYIVSVKFLRDIYHVYSGIGQSSYFLQTGIILSQILVFLLGIIYVMSKYYFANDLEQLVPLPIKPSYIIGSKFVTLMISEYITTLPLILPFIFIYGRNTRVNILYWIYSILIILLIPILPLIIVSIIVMAFMKYTNIKGRKDLFRVISGIFFIGIIIYIQIILQNYAQRAITDGSEFYINLISDSNFLVKKMGQIFPPGMWATLSLVNHGNIMGIAYLLLFLLVSLLGYFIMLLLSESLFYGGLIGNTEVRTSRGREKRNIRAIKSTKVSKPYIALAKKETLILIRTPIYLINSVLGSVIVPIIGFVSIYSNDVFMTSFKEILNMYPQYVVLASIGIIVFQGIANSVGSTTFSREGKNFWIQRTLPITVKDQIIGRILAALFPQLIALLSLLIVESFIISLSIIDIFLIIFIGLLGSISMAEIGMIIDILKPLLIWDNPQRAMKQNLNVLISLGIGSLYILILGYLVIKLIGKVNINYIYILLSTVFIITSIILFMSLRKLIKRQFENIE
ncbi:MAG: hypothetical protein GX214_03545 [Clostridiales bacterium]|nr:hypothetical protein [Clostridiales bacterium]